MTNNLKIGVYVDMENIRRCGGHGIRYDVLRRFAARVGGTVLRMNTYLAFDPIKADESEDYAQKQRHYQNTLRRAGWKVIVKQVRHFENENGEITTKANADLDLAVDALLQSDNLDKVILVTGDGDFVKVVDALQNKGCRVDLVAFKNCSGELRCIADNFYSGFTIPNLIPIENTYNDASSDDNTPEWGELGSRVRGIVSHFDDTKKYGFVRFANTINENLWIRDDRCEDSPYDSAYFHISDFNNYTDPRLIKRPDTVVEFSLCKNDKSRKEKFAAKELEIIAP